MEEEAMTILFVFNGAYNFSSPTEWSVDRIIGATSHRKRRVSGEDEDEENTLNGNGETGRRGKKTRRSVE